MPLKFLFAISLVVLVGTNVVAACISKGLGHPNEAPLIAWFVSILTICFAFGVIGRLPPLPDWRGVLIDQRNKISLSRLQLVLWSLLVISVIVTEGVFNAIWGNATPLNLNIPSQMWVLLGLSGATAVAAPVVNGIKADANHLHTKGDNEHAWRDIFYGDDTGNCDQVDFSKVQQFFFTVGLVLVYAVAIGGKLIAADPASHPLMDFPALDAGFIGIMGVSQLAYIAYKAVPHDKTDA